MRLLVLCLLTLTGSCRALQCVNEEGKPVDWLVMYKLPREAGTKNKDKSFVNQGKVSVFIRAVSKLRNTEEGGGGVWEMSNIQKLKSKHPK